VDLDERKEFVTDFLERYYPLRAPWEAPGT
jgi:hypothetical protein